MNKNKSTSDDRFAVLTAWALTILLLVTPAFPRITLFHHLNDYLAAHQIVEIFAMVVAGLVFAVGWNVHREVRPGNISILSATFLGVALITLAHTLSYKGMPDFVTPSGSEKAIGFWLSMRACGACGLLLAALLPWRRFSHPQGHLAILAMVLLWVALTYWLVLFQPHLLPRTFLPDTGLTTFKVTAEAALVGIYLLAALLFLRPGAGLPNARWMASACWVMGLAGGYFCLYDNPFDIYNQIGHIYNVIAYGLLYQGLFISTIRDPYIRLQQAQDELEGRVAERTGALSAALISLERQQHDLEQAKLAADRANLAKSEFLSSMSHELRTPLNAIIGFAQLLRTGRPGPLTAKQAGQIDHITRGGQHLLELINEVLDLARIETGRLSLSVESIDPRAVMDECLAFGRSYARPRGIDIIAWQGGPVLPILVDYTRFKQILLNLISNAIKYNDDNGRVMLTAQPWGQGIMRFSVTDSGPGIPRVKQGNLFEPFNRLGAEASGTEGTGIGLTITKRLVQAMGGAIGFTSAEGQGSTFWVDMPTAALDQAVMGRHQTVIHLPDHLSGGRRRVLYVEDNPANVLLMEAFLAEIDGFALDCANTIESGLEKIKLSRPDIIVLDINLPGMSGLQAVRHWRSLPHLRDLPIIALSANVMPDAVRAGLAAGFDRYLTKPLDFNVFLQAVQELTQGEE
ncbi:MASE3 domain-containing protein [Magnetospirillum sulfuroxidans]|uniref:histidine kinase n=1 Tax=Magnetospirillum sulfuroxidans TaxID=611300 RepID=A0ABS5IAH7_9PROT|nr:MASE3 domain-containing protein [Magnetospirillum sulfuroxidans]MBR9970713.1 response regulator [Magnetospirillum sulfuroxidans]